MGREASGHSPLATRSCAGRRPHRGLLDHLVAYDSAVRPCAIDHPSAAPGPSARRFTPPHTPAGLRTVPPDHLEGLIQGQFLTCGPVGHVLMPYQMARKPVTVALIYKGRTIASVHLVRQPRFDFVIIGPRPPTRTHNPDRLEQPPQMWNASFVVTTSTGRRDGVSLGGIWGSGGHC